MCAVYSNLSQFSKGGNSEFSGVLLATILQIDRPVRFVSVTSRPSVQICLNHFCVRRLISEDQLTDQDHSRYAHPVT